jgi:hypothetical protein
VPETLHSTFSLDVATSGASSWVNDIPIVAETSTEVDGSTIVEDSATLDQAQKQTILATLSSMDPNGRKPKRVVIRRTKVKRSSELLSSKLPARKETNKLKRTQVTKNAFSALSIGFAGYEFVLAMKYLRYAMLLINLARTLIRQVKKWFAL